MTRSIPCPWADDCVCTHTGSCVAGWVEKTVTVNGHSKDVAAPCPNCRPDLYAEICRRGHVPGESSSWVRGMRRPIVAMRKRGAA